MVNTKETNQDSDNDPKEMGSCDDCNEEYELASVVDHCVEEGLCWEHCSDEPTHSKEREDENLALMDDAS